MLSRKRLIPRTTLLEFANKTLGGVGHEVQGELPLQADEECAICRAVDGLACEGERPYRSGEGEATFEEDFVEDVLSRAAVADMVDM